MCNFDNVFTIYMIKLEEINWEKNCHAVGVMEIETAFYVKSRQLMFAD